jgi:hypothetical protein
MKFLISADLFSTFCGKRACLQPEFRLFRLVRLGSLAALLLAKQCP